MYSITKSVISALIGIAIEQKLIEGVNMPIGHFFEEIDDNSKKEITIKHLLMMSSGLGWQGNEAMIPTKNWVRFILGQPIETSAGMEMRYSCGNSHLLSAILQRVAKMDTVAFAQKYLFAPLGIQDFTWHYDSQGIAIGGFSLTMRAEDMLKLGILYMNQGEWAGKQIVPAAWINESTGLKIVSSDNMSYGYHWWILPGNGEPSKTYYAQGLRGQYIFVNEEKRLATVMTSNMDGDILSPIQYYERYIL
ncbi:serine hydrolase domain-containing protein [Paenibacillus sp. MMS18-CY102]|uniref:serine hydrolase domain-containing protein n=1 Tax=Paenibacillus sp. MMS18-CY102 TaxID=2682849 RepID=UPI003FA6FEA5